jgi:hypothetical protein
MAFTQDRIHGIQHTPSTAYTEYSIHWVQHAPSTGYIEYSIRLVLFTPVLHHPMIDCLPLPASVSAFSRPCCTKFSTFSHLQVNQWIKFQLPSHMPTNLPPADSLPQYSLHPDWLPPHWPPADQLNPDHPASSFPPIMIGHGLQVYLPHCSIMASKCISKFIRSLPPNSSPTLLNHSLQLNLWVYSISLSPSASPTSSIPASKCISEFIHSQSPSA